MVEVEERPHQVMRQAKEARIRQWCHWGCSEKNALDPYWETPLGRQRMLKLSSHGEGITQRQYEAGIGFQRVITEFRSSVDAPRPSRKSPHDTLTMTLEEFIEWCQGCAAAYNDMRSHVLGSHGGPKYWQVMWWMIIDQRDPPKGPRDNAWSGNLRCGLNILDHYWG